MSKVPLRLPPVTAKKMKSIFGRDLCLDENTAQAASVEFVPPAGDKLCAQQTAKNLSESPEGGSDSLCAPGFSPERCGIYTILAHSVTSRPGTAQISW